jgi:hypothetical protein
VNFAFRLRVFKEKVGQGESGPINANSLGGGVRHESSNWAKAAVSRPKRNCVPRSRALRAQFARTAAALERVRQGRFPAGPVSGSGVQTRMPANPVRRGGVINPFSRGMRSQNGGGKMRAPRLALTGGAGCIIFLTRIFLTSPSRKIGNGLCANSWSAPGRLGEASLPEW